MAEVKGVQIIIHPEAGPFVPMGFTPELKEKLEQAGFTDGYKLAEVLGVKGVSLLPLEDMNTDVFGFRVNVVYPDRLDAGLKKIEAFIQAVARGEEKYESYSTEIAKFYEGNDPEKDPRLSADAIERRLPETRAEHERRVRDAEGWKREFERF